MLPSTESLLPVSGGDALWLFPSASTSLVRIDLIDEAGAAWQSQPLVAGAAARLHLLASRHMSAPQVAEWLDYRGIVVESAVDNYSAHTTLYALRRYADELIDLVAGLRADPSFPADEFDLYCRRRRQQMHEAALEPRETARRRFYQALYPASHPLGCFAAPADVDRLSLDEVKRFYASRYAAPTAVVLSGDVDGIDPSPLRPAPCKLTTLDEVGFAVSPAEPRPADGPRPQASLRIGRRLPLSWLDDDYARLMLLCTALGGYFGSRLMQNLREDKGYTYGIYSRTQIYRGELVFFITADVAADHADDAVEQVRLELQRLCDQPLDEAELQMVRTVIEGDFLSSVDGIFERAERLCSMLKTCVDERLTDHLRQALASATAADLLATARRWLQPDQMTVVVER